MTESTYEINLIIEDGNCKIDANSYVSLAYADTYAVNRNYSTWLNQSDYVRKAAIIKAMDYVDNLFDWKGIKMNPDQALSFPRLNIIDGNGYNRTGCIPEQLKKAVCEAAFYVQKQYSLFASNDTAGAVKKTKKKADVVDVEKEYFSSKETKIDYTSAYQSLDNLLKGLYKKKGDVSIIRNVHWNY